MRKFSKSAHATMHELNITPLLDLAFVLLVIFIITTAPPIEDRELNLPESTPKPKDPVQKANYVSIESSGQIYLNAQTTDLAGLYKDLIELRTKDPDLNVIVRGDSKLKYQHIVNVLDVLQKANVLKLSMATEASREAEPKK